MNGVEFRFVLNNYKLLLQVGALAKVLLLGVVSFAGGGLDTLAMFILTRLMQ